MKKLFASVPMNGQSEEDIKRSIEFMHKMAELVFGEELEVIDTYTKTIPDTKRENVWCLGQSISQMADADYFIGVFTYYSETFRGCSIEYNVAKGYGIQTFMVNQWETLDVFKHAAEFARANGD